MLQKHLRDHFIQPSCMKEQRTEMWSQSSCSHMIKEVLPDPWAYFSKATASHPDNIELLMALPLNPLSHAFLTGWHPHLRCTSFLHPKPLFCQLKYHPHWSSPHPTLIYNLCISASVLQCMDCDSWAYLLSVQNTASCEGRDSCLTYLTIHNAWRDSWHAVHSIE